MENREFISAADLPTTEAEEVSVLCLENGELKQKPAKGLGGGYDATVTLTFSDEETIVELTSGSYDAIRAKVLAGDAPNIKVICLAGTWHSIASVISTEVCEDTEEDECIWLSIKGPNDVYVGIRPDNTMFID